MTTVVRLGPLPLQRRRASRVAELERILGTVVQLVEVFSTAQLVTAVEDRDVVAVALDAPQPGGFTEAVRSCRLAPGVAAGLAATPQRAWRDRRGLRRLRAPHGDGRREAG